MQKQTVALLIGSFLLIAAGALVAPSLFGEDEIPLRRWDATDEVEVAAVDAGDPATGESAETAGLRSEVAVDEFAANPRDDARVAVTLRGRVVDKFAGPVAAATVWLDYSRGGRGGGGGGPQRRVPDPVRTDAEGRFAFQGETFRNLRVTLRVAHSRHAAGLFDKDLGPVGAEVDLGDLVLVSGGVVTGRVTDLEQNGIADARIELSPENGNRWRMARERAELIEPVVTDASGYYRIQHVPAGEWSAGATAKMHTEGRSTTFAVEEDREAHVDDIRLGPGFEVTGFVRDTQGQPIAKARVTMRNVRFGPPDANAQSGGNGGGPGGRRGGFQGFGQRDHSTTTDDKGRFFLEHLPGIAMRLEATADGYLDHQQDNVDPKIGRPIEVAMQDGLRIAGTVVDRTDKQPVTMFAYRANRVRGLPIPGAENVDIGQLLQRLREGNLDEQTRAQIQQQMETLRSNFGGQFGGRGPRGPGNDPADDPRNGGRRGQNGLGKPERHPGGTFVATGLQEGVYEVILQSPDHALCTSAEVELRAGAPAPSITIELDRGFYLAGVVVTDGGEPIRNATVQLRSATAMDSAMSAMGRRGRNGGPGGNATNGGGQAPDIAAIGRDFQRMATGTSVQLEVRTDAEGEFTFRHLATGKYRLQAEADAHSNAEIEIELAGDRSDARMELGRLGTLIGKVFGVAVNELADAHVAAVPMPSQGGGFNFGMMRGGRGGPGGMFQRAEIGADGSYRFDGLEPASYLVRAYIGSQQDILRELLPQFMGGNLQADVEVKGGATAKLDLQVHRAQVGDVAGSVMHNGRAAEGFRVELQQISTNQNDNAGGPGFGPGGGRGGRWNNTQQATVTSSGTFKIERVQAGDYTLRVQTQDRTTVHEEPIQVVTGGRTERHVQVETSSLRGSVSSKDGTVATELDGNVTLLAGLTALPADYNPRRGGGGINTQVQDGAFQFASVPPGNYLMVLSMRGRERTTTQVVVGAGGEQTVAVEAGAIAPVTNSPNGGNAPNAAPGSGRVGGRGGNGGTGLPGQGGGGRRGQQGGNPGPGGNTGNPGGRRGG